MSEANLSFMFLFIYLDTYIFIIFANKIKIN